MFRPTAPLFFILQIAVFFTSLLFAQQSSAQCETEFKARVQAASEYPNEQGKRQLNDLRRIEEDLVHYQNEGTLPRSIRRWEEAVVNDISSLQYAKTLLSKCTNSRDCVEKKWGVALGEWNVCRSKHAVAFGKGLQSGASGLPASGSSGSSPSTNQLPAYRGSTPQSGEECMSLIKGGAREKGFKDPVDQINQHLACLAEWKKVQQARQGDQPVPSVSQSPEQQMTQQAAAQARETQAKGDEDAKRQGRRRHDPAMEAHECIKPNFGGLYGGMINSCPYKVNYSYCGFRPKENSWLTVMDCEKQKFGAGSVAPNREDATHTKGVESLHWFACKDPALPMEGSFDGGQIHGRCRVLFAN